MKALELKNLSKTYPPRASKLEPKIAVSDLSFTIEQGEVFGFLGPNGAGKSTTIGMVSGLVQPTSGSAQVFGHDCVRDAYTTRGMVGLVPQELSFDPFFTPREALEIQSGLFNVPKDKRWTEEILERLSLAPVANNHVRTLSGGMKRRLLVAKALVHKPKLLILDEPTAGVDVELRRDLWAFVKELNAQGTTILLTTHHMEEVEAMAQRIAIMSNGVLRALDTLTGLRAASGKEKLEDIYLHFTSK